MEDIWRIELNAHSCRVADEAQASGLGVQSTNVNIWGEQLELGAVATPFERRPVATELALCQRYYEKTFDYGVIPANGTGNFNGAIVMPIQVANSNASSGVSWVYKTTKRRVPTMSLFVPRAGGASGQWTNNSTELAAATATFIGDSSTLLFENMT